MISASQSRSISLPDPGIVGPRAKGWTFVAKWNGPAQPIELQLSVAPQNDVINGFASFPVRLLEGFCGQQYSNPAITWEPQFAAAFRVTYGGGGTTRTIVIDLRSQKLYLGVCEEVTVECMRWRLTAWGSITDTATVSAAIFPASGGPCDEATNTVLGLFPSAAAVNAGLIYPAHARYIVPICTPYSPSVFWGGTTPDIYFTGGFSCAFRAASYAMVPNLSRFEVAWSEFSQYTYVSSNAIVLTQNMVLGCRFYIST